MIRPTNVKSLGRYRIWLQYSDGVSGKIDLSNVAGKGVFKAWDEPGCFDQVHVAPHRAIAWGNDVELCPDAAVLGNHRQVRCRRDARRLRACERCLKFAVSQGVNRRRLVALQFSWYALVGANNYSPLPSLATAFARLNHLKRKATPRSCRPFPFT